MPALWSNLPPIAGCRRSKSEIARAVAVNVELVKEFVVQNLKDVRTVRDVAQRFGVSSDVLRKEFLRKERTNLSEFVLARKIDLMKDLLRSTDKKCFEICFEAGFAREDSAAKTFQRRCGVTMSVYRTASRSRDE